jgi:Flp pilus assembly protein TadB
MFKFLPGILLIQLVTAGLVLICIRWSQEPQFIIVTIAFAIIFAVLTTFWFGSIVQNIQKSTHAKLQEKHAQDREKIIRRAEREKAKVTSESYQQREKAIQKASAKANFRVGAAFALAIGAAGFMIFSQMVTVGLMVLVASGSGLAGYLFRMRQDRLSWKSQLPLPKVTQATTKQIDAKKTVSGNSKQKTPE